MQRLTGKTILFTGAFGLIGKEICTHYMHEGARVAWADIHIDLEMVAWLSENFAETDFLVVEMDITNEQQVAEGVEKMVAHFGTVDVLVNNAAIDAKFDKTGVSKVNESRFENYPLDLLRKSVDVNLTGTILVTQVVCRQMLKQGHGNIINVASTYSVVTQSRFIRLWTRHPKLQAD